jgi:hypothetical protein
MMVIGLGALLVFGGVLYMVRAVIWRGPLSGSGSSRSGPVPDNSGTATARLGVPRARTKLAGLSPHSDRCNSVVVGDRLLAPVIGLALLGI